MKRLYAALLLQATVLVTTLFVSANSSIRNVDDPQLTLENYSLFVDGAPVAENVGSCGGRILWFSLPHQGQFILSSKSHEGHGFERMAELRSNTISFSLQNKSYQSISTAPILSDGGEMELWVLHDAEFQPEGCGESMCAGSASSFEYFLEHREREGSR